VTLFENFVLQRYKLFPKQQNYCYDFYTQCVQRNFDIKNNIIIFAAEMKNI